MQSYVPVWVKSNFSFLGGASHPEELVEQAHALGLPAIAITDLDGVYGIVEAHVRARQLGIKLLVGAEISVGELLHNEATPKRVVLLAQDREGYGQLCRLISIGRLRSAKGSSMVVLEELLALNRGLLALCPEAELLPHLRDAFGDRLYALFCRQLRAEEQPREQAIRRQARRLGIALVGTNEVLYHTAARQPLHDILCCVRHKTTLRSAGTAIRPNAEHDLKPPQVMRRRFSDDLASLDRTREVADRCRFSLSELRYRYPAQSRPDGRSEAEWLRELTLRGARQRYGDQVPSEVTRQIERELVLIEELDYGGYFLSMWEIVQFCRRENILCQGRGSAANSAVCYCLEITAVDPIKLDLLFERFISRERAEPPDIDLDIEHKRREEVIQFVYRRYGRRHAAMVANLVRYRTRSALREVGKVLGIPAIVLDQIAKLAGGRVYRFDQNILEQAGVDTRLDSYRHLLRLVREMRGFPRHLSVHPGGFILGHEPVDTIVPIEPASMPGRSVIQWDKYAIEELGLFKVDLLGLGALTQVHHCLDLLRQRAGVELEFSTIPQEDPATYRMISRAETVGVFQIESRAQMSMLPRLKPSTFYDLVMEVAIVRPGPIQGNMVHPYLNRRNRLEKVEYPHPSLERILSKTLGVPIFQEQVMKIAVSAGGYTPGEADQLRRDMSAWKSAGRIEQHHERLISRMVANGIPPEFAERIFSQIRGFGEYGFPESHAASFALIVYVTAWLKCHYPAFFTCSLLNAQPMGFYSPSTIVHDAKRNGVEVRPVDVCASRWDCTLEPSPEGYAVRMGLRYVKGFGEREREACERVCGDCRDLEQFTRQSKLSKKALSSLAQAGAFQSFGLSRRDAIWKVMEVVSRLGDSLVFAPREADLLSPRMFKPLTLSEEIFWDYRICRHSPRGHPMLHIRPMLDKKGIPRSDLINAMADGSRTRYVGMVICRQQPATKSRVTFYTVEDESGFVNLVVWHPVFERHPVLARTALLMGITGKVQSQNDVVYLIADELWDPRLEFQPQGATTRSFC
ncbi:MAG: error-prone DNA polymerase [Deltaproteobacteria bacterium]|nr:error-prone DNA polymerase [Deltaproteobacteria bacterium]